MPDPNKHLSVPPRLTSESDPCSFTYQRYYSRDDAISRSPSVSPKRSDDRVRKQGRWKAMTKGLVKSIKKAFGSKSVPPFVMPHEYKKLHPSRSSSRSSLRSHRSAAMRMAQNRISAPAVMVSRPSTEGRSVSYRVHSYSGVGSPPAKQDSVRFSHPPVNNVTLRPDTPATMLSMHSSRMDVDDACNIQTSTTADLLTDSNGHSSAGPPPIRPKKVWRESDQFKTFDDTPVSFDEFKARLDGHKLRSDPPIYKRMTAERPPSLQFIPKLSDLHMDDSIPEPQLADIGPVDIQKNRDDALRMLEYGGVLAVLPQGDMPSSAVPVLSGQYPSYLTHKKHPPSLIPGQHYRHPPSLVPGAQHTVDPRQQRPSSFPAPKQVFRAYNPAAYEFMNPAPQAKPYAPPSAPPSEKKQGKMAARPEELTVDARVNAIKAKVAELTKDLDIDIPESSEIRRSRAAQLTREKLTHHKAASTANVHHKPLPPTPGPFSSLRPTNASVPSPHKMNDNGYPVQNLREAATIYAADPKYQRRSMNEVEAKFQRERGDKKGKDVVPDKKLAKLQNAKAEADKKLAKEQEKRAKKEAEKAAKIAKKEKKKADALKKRPDLLEKQKQIDESLKKLVFV